MTRGDSRHQDVIDAALSLFIEKGYHATKVNEIAHKANISMELFYDYFSLTHLANAAKEYIIWKIHSQDMLEATKQEIILQNFTPTFDQSTKTSIKETVTGLLICYEMYYFRRNYPNSLWKELGGLLLGIYSFEFSNLMDYEYKEKDYDEHIPLGIERSSYFREIWKDTLPNVFQINELLTLGIKRGEINAKSNTLEAAYALYIILMQGFMGEKYATEYNFIERLHHRIDAYFVGLSIQKDNESS